MDIRQAVVRCAGVRGLALIAGALACQSAPPPPSPIANTVGIVNGVTLVFTPSCRITADLLADLARLDSIPGVRVEGVFAATPQQAEDEAGFLDAMALPFPMRLDASWNAELARLNLRPPVLIVVHNRSLDAILGPAESPSTWNALAPHFGLDPR
jgi:hypothetical protein